jgi:hypothetical protein
MTTKLMRYIMYFLLLLSIAACSTTQAVKERVSDSEAMPQTFEDTLIEIQNQISAVRDVTAVALQTGNLKLEIAQDIQKKTREYRDQVDLIKIAYSGVANIQDCKIVYNGHELPCQGQADQILATLQLMNEILNTQK